MSARSPLLGDPLEGAARLEAGDTFRFGCHPGLACFGSCCADVTVVLTPLDVVRLARRLGVATGYLLHAHTVRTVARPTGLPVVLLRMRDEDRRCPFVEEAGCTVYTDRPWACRMYPLVMGLPPARAGRRPRPVYALLEEERCLGHREAREWTVARWREDQGLLEREPLDRAFDELVGHPWFIGGRRLDRRRQALAFMGLYDLDRFRTFVFESTFLSRFVVDAELAARLAVDDEELLLFAFRWLRFALFGEPTLSIRPHRPRMGRVV